MSQTWKKRSIALGGTFDHFHAGHQRFIEFAAQQGGHLVIGVTQQPLTRHKPWPELIQPFQVRKRAVIQFCQRQGIACTVVPLSDRMGPALTDVSIFGLALTEHNIATGRELVETRKKLGLKPLETFVCPLVTDAKNEVISSSQIRAGRINRQGESYADVIAKHGILSNHQKDFFSKVQGDLVSHPSRPLHRSKVCVVGDTSLEQFIEYGWKYHLGVYDLKKQRETVQNSKLSVLIPDATVANPAGQITSSLVTALENWLETPGPQFHLFVTGEEDLAAVALVLLSPLETQIYYGQPNQGLVLMTVTEQLKERIAKTLNTA